MRVRAIAAAIAACVVVTIASTAAAMTADQVVTLVKGGVSEAVILAAIARDDTPFELNADELVALKQQGVSDAILMAMLKSGRGETAQAPITVVAPEVLIIGHGPDIPNTSYWDRLYWNPSYVIPFVPAYAPPYQTYSTPLLRPLKPRRTAR